MGFINQASATAANSPKITISMVVELTTDCNMTVLEFGPDNGVGALAGGSIQISNVDNLISVYLSGVVGSVAGDELASHPYLTTTDTTNDSEWIGATDPTSLWTPYFTTQATSVGSPIDAGNRFHLFIAADFTNETALGGGTNTFFMFLNGSRLTLDTGGGTSGNSPVIDQASGQVQCSMDSNPHLTYANIVNHYINGPFSYTRSVFGGGTATVTGSVPGFSIDINGKEIGIPCQAVHAATGIAGAGRPAIKMADVQIWVGQYIDPTIHMDKFFADGKPVNPADAETAFGAPSYRAQGPSSGITANGGTGGNFTASGTITDTTF